MSDFIALATPAAAVHEETRTCGTHLAPEMAFSDISDFIVNKTKDIVPYLFLAVPVGAQRLRFSDDLWDNAISALSRLYCPKCAGHFSGLYPKLRHMLSQVAIQASKDARLRDLMGDDLKKQKQNLIEDRNAMIPAISFIFKKLDYLTGGSTGFYTLFNRIRILNDKKYFSEVFSARLDNWLFRSPDTFKQDAIDTINKCMDDVFSRIPAPPPFKLTFHDFLMNRDLWATSGSVDQRTPKDWVHSKAAFAYSLSDDQLWTWWMQHRNDKPIYEVFSKPDEVAGFRAIVTTDLVTYIKIAYQNLVFEPALAKLPEIWSLKSGVEKLDAFTSMQEKLAAGAESLFCDGSGWDEGLYLRELLHFYELKAAKIGDVDPDAALDTLVWQLSNVMVRLPDGSIKPHLHGLPSGSRDTTNFNSVVNLCIVRMIDPVAEAYVLGDDNILIGTNFSMDRAADVYSNVDMKLNRIKSGHSYVYGEFLKTIIAPGLLSGFPVRAMRSLLFTNSHEREKDTPVHTQRADLWSKYISRTRCNNWAVFLPYMTQDIMKASKLFTNQQDVELWLFSSRQLGGGGFGNRGIRWRVVSGESEKIRRVVGPRKVRQRQLFDMRLLWQRGFTDKISSLMREKEAPPPSVKIIKTFVTDYMIAPFLLPPFFLTKAAALVAAPKDKYHDTVSLCLDGIRNKREAIELAESVRSVAPNLAVRIKELFRRYSSVLALSILKGNPVSGFAPCLSLALGDAAAELLSGCIASFSLGLLPRGSGLEYLERVTGSVIARMTYPKF